MPPAKSQSVARAVRSFEAGQISLGKAAQLAGVSRADFTRQLASMAVPVVRTNAEELARELEDQESGCSTVPKTNSVATWRASS